MLYNYKYGDGTAYNLWIAYVYPFPTLYFALNMQVALSGFHVPGPAAISLLGLGGLVVLRRRRARLPLRCAGSLTPTSTDR